MKRMVDPLVQININSDFESRIEALEEVPSPAQKYLHAVSFNVAKDGITYSGLIYIINDYETAITTLDATTLADSIGGTRMGMTQIGATQFRFWFVSASKGNLLTLGYSIFNANGDFGNVYDGGTTSFEYAGTISNISDKVFAL